ncbi:MAG: PEP-CTERM sorting domain-containing protein [Methylococcaceae bacterium]
MKKLVLGSFIFASTFLSVGFAQAGILKFDDATTNGTTGFTLGEFKFGDGANVVDASTLDANAFSGSNVAFNENGGSIVITRADDGLFSFGDFSIGSFGNSIDGYLVDSFSVTVLDNNNVSHTSEKKEFSSQNSWMTLSSSDFIFSSIVDFGNIYTLEISGFDPGGESNYFMLDDIDLTANDATNDVPEPEALALMLLGLPMMGWVARRRNNTTHTL